MTPDLSIVVPLYNEGAHLDRVLAELEAVLDAMPYVCELILVDDGSTDQTWSVIRTAEIEHIRGIRLSRNFGKEAALAAGLEHARGRAAIIMDGDLQHPPALIPEMVRIWEEQQVGVVEAVKRDPGKVPFWHRLASRFFYKMLSGLPGNRLDGATDFKLLDRAVIEAWRRMGERNLFFRGMAHWLGFERRELVFDVPERVGERSRWSLFQLIRLATTGVTSFTTFPLQLTTLIGLVFLVFSVLLGGQTLYMKLSGAGVDGFTTVILLILITGSLILISLGVMGIYIARIYEEVKARPRYLIANAHPDPEAGAPSSITHD